MQTTEFLRLVTPTQGQKAVVVPKGKSAVTGKALWFHYPCDSLESMQHYIDTVKAKHIYFALGGFKSGSIDEFTGRKQDNVEFLKSFWLDIDIAVDVPTKYASKRIAVVHLSKFIEAEGLPEPIIVSSGSGLHVYWPMADDVPRDQWKVVALALKSRTTYHKLLVDNSRTADEASILRPVGTWNKKTDVPREVKALVWDGEPTDFATFRELLGAQQGLGSPVDLTPPSGFTILEGLAANLSNVDTQPKIAKRILENCRQMRWAFEHMKFGADGVDPSTGDVGEAVSQPLWRAGIHILARCKNGSKFAHAFSKPYPGYSEVETQGVVDRAGDKPYTCSSFNELNPGRCDGCSFAGKIKSPIVLGINYTELEAPKFEINVSTVVPSTETASGFEVVKNTHSIARMQPGFPYKRTDSGIVREERIPVVDTDTGKVRPNEFTLRDVPVAPYDIYPLYMTEGRESELSASNFSSYWIVQPTHDSKLTRTIQLNNADTARQDTLRAKLAEHSVYAATDTQHKGVHAYMLHYMQQLNSTFVHREARHFGWQADVVRSKPLNEQELEFVVGHTRIFRREVEGVWTVGHEDVMPTPEMTDLAEAMDACGTLEDWAKGAAWYQDDYASRYITCFLLGAGSPFMKFLKSESVVVLARGEAGVGKSNLQRLIGSVWASPIKYNKGGFNTLTAAESTAALLKNLTICMDDKLAVDREALKAEIMMLANGKGKGRGSLGSGNGVTLARTKTWSAVTVMSSNDSWVQVLGSTRYDNEGPFARLYEVELNRIKSTQWPIQGTRGEDAYKNYIESNYGLVGPMAIRQFLVDPKRYVEKLMVFEDVLQQAIQDRAEEGDKALQNLEASNYRLHLSAAAAGMLMLYFLRQRKLVNWSYEAYTKEIVDAIAEIAHTTVDNRPSKNDILGQYLNEHHGAFVIVTSQGLSLSGVAAPVGGEASYGKVPNNKVVGRIDYVVKSIYLDRQTFKTWLSDKGLSENAVLQGLQSEGWGVKAGQTVRATLGRGFPACSRVQTRVIELTGPVDQLEFQTTKEPV